MTPSIEANQIRPVQSGSAEITLSVGGTTELMS